MPEIHFAHTNEDYAVAAELFREYAAWLGIDLGFQNFTRELQELRSMYGEPAGAIILCLMTRSDRGGRSDRVAIGCVAIRKLETGIGELKRMYVKPAWQRKGIGVQLLEKALDKAILLGYNKLRLDTLRHMEPAMNLYKRYGFYEIPAYYFNPEETAVYFEKELAPRSDRVI